MGEGMDARGALQRVVQEAIDAERLGQPQFMRCVARAPEGGSLGSTLDALVSMGESWFGGPAATRTRRGEGSGVYLTEMSTWGHGPVGRGYGERVRRADPRGYRPDGRRQPRHPIPPGMKR